MDYVLILFMDIGVIVLGDFMGIIVKVDFNLVFWYVSVIRLFKV